MTKGIFITGTDTGVGKTIASGLLMKALVMQDYNVIGMKPIASGAEYMDGKLRNEDATYLIQHSNVEAPYELINPYCFEPAIAPHIAAQQAGLDIDLSTIKQKYKELTSLADWVIVEGVGGWKVPVNKKERVSDIPTCLNIPVIMVVGMKLGCINHALLTAESIRAKGNRLLGWIANQIDPEMEAFEENLQTLEAYLECPLIASLPYFVRQHNDLNQDITINTEDLKS